MSSEREMIKKQVDEIVESVSGSGSSDNTEFEDSLSKITDYAVTRSFGLSDEARERIRDQLIEAANRLPVGATEEDLLHLRSGFVNGVSKDMIVLRSASQEMIDDLIYRGIRLALFAAARGVA